MSIPQLTFADERRISVILVQYWNQLRGDDEFPREDQIEPDRLIGVWERCFMVQLRDIEKEKDYNYSYFGSDLNDAYADGRLDPDNKHIAAPDASRLAERYAEVIEERGPIMDEDEYQDQSGRMVRYRQIFMPLSDAQGKIKAILGGSWFRLD